MRRMTTFFLGMAAGGVLIYAALSYHVIQTADGLHLVPKRESTLAATYVDIRGLGPVELVRDYPAIAQAIVASDRTDLIESAASDVLRTGIDRVLGPAPVNP